MAIEAPHQLLQATALIRTKYSGELTINIFVTCRAFGHDCVLQQHDETHGELQDFHF